MKPDPIDVPIPGLVALIGAAGAGKSTLAGRLFEPSEILSSDALREAISGDASDQRATRPAFGILHREIRRRLAAGRLVVVDATNVEPAARRSLISLARRAAVPALAIAIIPSRSEVHARNAGRIGRIVPPAIVDRHLERAAALGADPDAVAVALLGEGFARAHVLRTPDELDAVRIRRRVADPLSRP